MAAPFFNDSQRDLCTFIEELGQKHEVPIYSPRSDGFVLRPNASIQERDQIFESNIKAIVVSKWVLAVIDDFDPGTIWEMGYARGIGVGVLAYSDVPGRGLNVMLAGASSLGFINGRVSLMEFFERGVTDFPKNIWAGEIQ